MKAIVNINIENGEQKQRKGKADSTDTEQNKRY